MATELLMFFLLLLAIAIGFAFGRWRSHKSVASGVDPKFYLSLNYLLNDEQDRAVDSLIEQLGIDEATFDTYLALGTSVRKRGEVDKAINIHQNLLARPELPLAKRVETELALASDFLGAGLLGRAENLLLSMLEQQGNVRGEIARLTRQRVQALLVGLYERESDWHKALTVSQILAKADASYKPLAAHLGCELAESVLPDVLPEPIDASPPLISAATLSSAREYIKQARKSDPGSARVALVAGKIELYAGDWPAALKHFENALVQDADLGLDLLPLASHACDGLQDATRLLAFVQQAISAYAAPRNVQNKTSPATPGRVKNATTNNSDNKADNPREPGPQQAPAALLLAQAQLLDQLKGRGAAQQALLQHLGTISSVGQLSGLLSAIDAQALVAAIPSGLQQTLALHLQRLAAVHHGYQCRNCGFGASTRSWRCPSCQQWGRHRAVA